MITSDKLYLQSLSDGKKPRMYSSPPSCSPLVYNIIIYYNIIHKTLNIGESIIIYYNNNIDYHH